MERIAELNSKERLIYFLSRLIDWHCSKTKIISDKSVPAEVTSLIDSRKVDKKSTFYLIADETLKPSYLDQIYDSMPSFLVKSLPKNTIDYKIFTFFDFYFGIPIEKAESFQDFFKYNLTEDKGDFPVLNIDNLIHCVMIVKNAGENFYKILSENAKYIDEWTILDTGSTDGTDKMVAEFLKDRKGSLYKEPFINFRDSRNRAFELAGESCVFNLVLDDSYVLKNGEKLREYLTIFRQNSEINSFSLKIISSVCSYDSCRITRSKAGLRYKYRVHESIRDPKLSVVLPMDTYIYDEESEYMKKRTESRMKTDLQILKEEYRENPSDPRNIFYIAQSYTGLEDYKQSYKWYAKRIKSEYSGFDEEIYCSHYRRALIAEINLGFKWKKCHQLYLKAFNSRPHRAEPLISIADYYYRNKNYELAYLYASRAYEKPFPIGEGLFVEKRFYDIEIPLLLTRLCLYFNKNELGLECSQKVLENSKEYKNIPLGEIQEYVSIYSSKVMVEKMNPTKEYSDLKDPRKVLCIVTDGNFYPWNGQTCDTKGLGGSETSAVKFGEELATRGYKVFVFCNCIDLEKNINLEEEYRGVQYLDIKKYFDFVANYKIDTCIVLRYSIYLPVCYAPNVKNVYLWLQDVLPQSSILVLQDNFRGAMCLTHWHKEVFASNFPVCPREKIFVTSNAIDITKFKKKSIRKNSFIYSSFPDRGLYHLLKMFPKIKKQFPEATLNVFCNTKLEVFEKCRDMMDSIETMLTQPGVTNHGWVNQVTLRKYWETTDFWFYPCTFAETACITSLEAAASETVAVCNDLAALKEMVGERGLIIPGDASTQKWQEKALTELFSLMKDSKRKEALRQANRKWVENMTYSAVTDRWEKEIFKCK